ncbi:unnamed protein product [Protopolystoma xenopodis]|uniref:Uncharacterized protein n=1 Tax=Protopolystoma xenopodis TaxID=117903 RepID=A0A3S5A078_9PLAT|nr:unnamed protein product [Protopolystoma xenopodis]
MTLCEVAETPLVDYVPSVLRNHIGEILQSSLRNNSNNFPDTNSLQNESVTPSTFCTITPLGTGCASTTEGSAYQSNDEAMMKTRLVQGGSQDGTGSVRRIVVTEDTDNRSTIVAYFDMPAQRSNIHSRISGQMGELAGEENSMMGLSEGQKTTITSLSGYNACNEYCSPDDILLEDARSNARNSEDFSPMSLVLLPSSEIKPCLSINHPDFEQDKSEWIRITFRFGKGQDLEMKMRRSARLR